MKMIFEYLDARKKALFFVLVLILIFLTYFWRKDSITTWDRYSEVLPIGKMIQIQNEQYIPGNFMGIYTAEWGDYENYNIFLGDYDVNEVQYMSYRDQIGIHGTIFGVINKILYEFGVNANLRLQFIYFINILFTCICVAVLIYGIFEMFGISSACGILFFLAPMYNFFRAIHNLYWVFGVRIFPAVVVAIIVAKYRKNNIWKNKYYMYIFGAMLFCICNTFEFVSMEMILCVLPIILTIVEKYDFKEVRIFIISSMACIFSFVISLGIWFIQCLRNLGNLQSAKAHMWYIVGSRAGLDAIEGENLSELGKSISAFDVIGKFLWGEGSYLCGPVKMIHVLLVAVMVYFVKLLVMCLKKQYTFNLTMTVFWVCSLLASISWMVISQAHSFHHIQLTGILWFFSFIPALGACTGKNIEYIYNMLKK